MKGFLKWLGGILVCVGLGVVATSLLIYVIAFGVRFGMAPVTQEIREMRQMFDGFIDNVESEAKRTMNVKRFKIEDWVEVEGKALRCETSYMRREIKSTLFPKPRLGQVVGMRRLFKGQLKVPKYADSDVLRVLKADGSELVWLVRFGMTNRAVEVRDVNIQSYPGLDRPLPLRCRWEKRP